MTATKRSLKRCLAVLLSVITVLSLCLIAAPALASYVGYDGGFRYEHDPRLNSKAMSDIVPNSKAVYGYAPSPTGSLTEYLAFDWGDPDTVARFREERIAYHTSIGEMYDLLDEMVTSDISEEIRARVLCAKRNELRLAACNTEEELAATKQRNMEVYGHEEGPLPEELYNKYGSWGAVIEKAFTINSGMDACCGLYDDYYYLYLAAGQVEDETKQAATREYSVASFVSASGLSVPSSTYSDLEVFKDFDDVSPYYGGDLATAVAAGVIKGYDDGTLKPKDSIRRVEALVILSRCLPELPTLNAPLVFSDVPEWAKTDVDRLSAAGLVLGYGDGTVGATDNLTVYQVGLLTERMETQTYLQAMTNANSLETLMKNHKSVTATITYYSNTVTRETSYLTSDTLEISNHPDGDKLLYAGGMVLSANKKTANLYLSADEYAKDYASAAAACIFDGYAQQITSSKTENGLRYITTETKDASVVSDMLQNYYKVAYESGDVIVRDYVFDANTFEIISANTSVNRPNGYVDTLSRATYAFDAAHASSTEFADYNSGKNRTSVTVYYALEDAAASSTRTFSVPDSYEISFYVNGSVTDDTYTDPPYTKAYTETSIKGVSSLRLYIPLQKSVSGPDPELFKKLVAANSSEKLLDRHDSIRIEALQYKDGENVYGKNTFIDGSTYAYTDSTGYAQMIQQDLYIETYSGNHSMIVENFLNTHKAYADLLAENTDYYSVYSNDKEVVTATTRDKSSIYVTTETTDKDYIQSVFESTKEKGIADGYTYENGMVIVYYYVFDANNYDLKSGTMNIRYPDGTEKLFSKYTYKYDGGVYDVEATPLAPYFTATESRYITVTYAADTDKPYTMKYQLPQGAYFYIYYDGKRISTNDFYTDPACTVHYQRGTTGDLVLYLKAQ